MFVCGFVRCVVVCVVVLLCVVVSVLSCVIIGDRVWLCVCCL